MNLNYNDSHRQKKNVHVYVFIQKAKKAKRLYIYSKSQTLFKKQDNFRSVFIHKKPYTLRNAIFDEIFEIGIYIFKEHDTFRSVTFYKIKAGHCKKSKKICVFYVFYIQKA